MNQDLIKTFVAGGAIAARRIVSLDGTGQAVQAAAGTDAPLGVSDTLGSVVAGERVDVHLEGIVELVAGGTFSYLAPVTADADGRAIAASHGDRVIGIALRDAVAGDIVDVHLRGGAPMVATREFVTARVGARAADGPAYAYLPAGGTITQVTAVLQGALAGADATITVARLAGGTGAPAALTGGVITATQAGSAAGMAFSASPTAANLVNAGDTLALTPGGGNTAAVTIDMTIEITRS